jgi:hypothetical protein
VKHRVQRFWVTKLARFDTDSFATEVAVGLSGSPPVYVFDMAGNDYRGLNARRFARDLEFCPAGLIRLIKRDRFIGDCGLKLVCGRRHRDMIRLNGVATNGWLSLVR